MPSPVAQRRREPREHQRSSRRRDETVIAKDDFTRLLASEEGRRVAARLLEQCLVTAPVFSQNAMVMSANAGKQEIGLWLQKQLREADLDNYLKMQIENEDGRA